MTPELINALKERIKQGQNKEAIKAETLGMGHSEEVFEAAYDSAFAETDDSVVRPEDEQLPRIWKLITEGVAFAKVNWNLTVLLAVPMLVALISAQVGIWFADNQIFVVTTSLITAFSFPIYFFLLAAVFYLVIKAPAGKSGDSKEGFLWARKRFFSFLFITALSTVMILGGFFLLIIPGIILSISLFFAAYVLVHEDVRGMSALTRSRALVAGRWWKVASKVVGISLIGMSAFLILGIIVGIVDGLFSVANGNSILFDIIFEPLSAFITVVLIFATNQLFVALKKVTPVKPVTKATTIRYWFLFVLGIVVIGLFVQFAIAVMNDPELLNTPMTVESKLLQLEVRGLSESALTFANTQDRSFAGVCATLTQQISMNTAVVVCNDSAEAWALTASVTEETWCADSTGFAKKIVTPLLDRTSCIEF